MWLLQSNSATRKRSAYSLVELVVVVGIITIIALSAIPNIFNRNDRLALDTAANRIRQAIIQARTSSLAPSKSDGSSSSQVYQVAFSDFGEASVDNSVGGNVQTNTVTIERGQAQCDSNDLIGGFATVKNIEIPRGIYISNFYPTNQTAEDTKAVIRFSVGKVGFVCGASESPAFQSTRIYDAGWAGKNTGNKASTARYLVIEIASTKISQKVYILVDRFTGEVLKTNSNPQSYFNPIADVLSPRWDNIDPNNFTLSIACSTSYSDITIGFPRARDRVVDAATTDSNLFVAYDIEWNTGSGATPVAIKYFHPLTEDTVHYSFSTDLFSIANQPSTVTIKVTAMDSLEKKQIDSDGDVLNRPRSKNFSLTCGTRSTDKEPKPEEDLPPQDDPGGDYYTCNPILYNHRQSLAGKVLSLLLPKTYAIAVEFCETTPDTEL